MLVKEITIIVKPLNIFTFCIAEFLFVFISLIFSTKLLLIFTVKSCAYLKADKNTFVAAQV